MKTTARAKNRHRRVGKLITSKDIPPNQKYEIKIDQVIPMGDQLVLYWLILPSVAVYHVQLKKGYGKEY